MKNAPSPSPARYNGRFISAVDAAGLEAARQSGFIGDREFSTVNDLIQAAKAFIALANTGKTRDARGNVQSPRSRSVARNSVQILAKPGKGFVLALALEGSYLNPRWATGQTEALNFRAASLRVLELHSIKY